MTDDYVGKQFGHYRLLRQLGTGNFAAVYLGEHRYLEVPAAIKILHVRMESGNNDLFLREARTIARLRHPHIVRVLDFGIEEEEHTPYLVMEYCPMGTLRTRHPKATRLPIELVVRYVQQIASALQYAHQQGVIHRDIKPENLLLTEQGEVVLSDFGLAIVRRTLDSFSASNMAGTPVYIAPEQIQHHPCPASDQYALGIMVYEWLTGGPPFPGPGMALLVQHLYQTPPGLCARLPHLHPVIEEVVFQALAKEPQQRFATVQDFAQALEGACTTTQPLILRSSLERESMPSVPTIVPSTGPQNSPSAPGQPPLLSTRRTDDKQILKPIEPPCSEKRDGLAALKQAPHSPALRNRHILLRKVHSFWIEGVLERSLHGAVLMTLGLQIRPDAVANPWHLILQQPKATPHSLPTGTRITEIYDAADGELLILGAPGAGKTTLLLELARDLLKRAEQDEYHPVPVVFNLSSWASKLQPLQDWLSEELATKYQVPHKLAQRLLAADQILPLLDGLDEVAPTARTNCIEAINTYHQEHGLLPLVVCSRQADYLAQTARVLLRSAVLVQPLTQEQVDAYLEQGGEPLWALRVALHQDSTLRELTSTPLMLSILMLTYYGKPVDELLKRTSLEERQRQIFEQYVRRMLTRRGPLKAGAPQQVVKWLAFLAARMRERNQTVFYLEHLQPDWLPVKERPAYGWWGIRLPAILIGILVALGISTFMVVSLTATTQLIFFAVLGGFLGGLFSRDDLKHISPSNHQRTHPQQKRRRIVIQVVISVLIGLLFALSYGLLLGKQFSPGDWLRDGSIQGVAFSLGCLFLQLIFSPGTPQADFSKKSSTRRWQYLMQTVYGRRTLLATIALGLVSGLSSGLRYGLQHGLLLGLGYGLLGVLIIGLCFGLISVLVNLILNMQADGVYLTERVYWTWSSLMSGLLKPRHRKTTCLLISIITVSMGLYLTLYYGVYYGPQYGLRYGLVSGLVYGPTNGLDYGLVGGLAYWIVLGLFLGISGEQIEEQSRQIPDQGIRRSLRNGVLMGIISSVVIWLVSILSYSLGYGLIYVLDYVLNYSLNFGQGSIEASLVAGLSSGLRYGLYGGWLPGLCGGILICGISGGLAALRHGIIRLLLRHAEVFPHHYVRFLDEAASCILLQKIGGGYSFVHRLLLEYFASLDSHPSLDLIPSPVNVRERRSDSSSLTLLSALDTLPLSQRESKLHPERRSFLRREVVMGLTGMGAMLTLGGVGWFLEQTSQQWPTEAQNLDFTAGTTSWFLAGSEPQDYTYGIDHTLRFAGKPAAYLQAQVAKPGGFGTLMQTFQGTGYRGKRLRMSGYVKAQAVEQWAALWMRVDGSQGRTLSFDNMDRRPILGTVDWKRYEIVLDVPEDSIDIAFGILLSGKGQVWLSEIQFQVVGRQIPTTGR
jgi:serine/threonine protein kinase/DNA polymerase III delta prime subunit